MRILKKWITVLTALLVTCSLSACTIPVPGFADYDVSAYIQALLDSSYHGSNEALMEVAGLSESEAERNNADTVENAAAQFCNTYGITPSRNQLQELEAVMKQAFALTKYTVKDERKIDEGYYLEVEFASITNFEDREADIAALRAEAEAELSGAASKPLESSSPEESSDGEETEPTPSPQPAEPPSESQINSLFVDKVVEFCIREVANISYDPETRSLPLDIRQTEDGELQLDMNQIEAIDQAVVRF